MKKIAILGIFLLVGMSFALALTPNFEVNKNAIVTGDWKYDGGWLAGNWQTASYDSYTQSPLALNGLYGEYERSGQAWKYFLTSSVYADAQGSVENHFNAITLNDPATTPATGGYTKYNFENHNFGAFTESHVLVRGQGAVGVSTLFDAESEFQQDTVVSVNEE